MTCVEMGPALLVRMIRAKTGIDEAVVRRVLEAYSDVTLAALNAGASVSALKDGYLYMKVIRRGRRITSTASETFRKTPPKRVVAYRSRADVKV